LEVTIENEMKLLETRKKIEHKCPVDKDMYVCMCICMVQQVREKTSNRMDSAATTPSHLQVPSNHFITTRNNPPTAFGFNGFKWLQSDCF